VIPAYEPLLIMMLRRYRNRGAPQSLLERLAGGEAAWRVLNDRWHLEDLRAARKRAVVDLGPPVAGLTAGERREAMIDLADKCGDVGAAFPRIADLAAFFVVPADGVAEELELLRHSGTIAWHIGADDAALVQRHAGAL
jgi:hypothetical protein